MPVTTSYPGVYLQESQLTSPTVTAATTSDTAFIGYFLKGPVNRAVKITSLADFSRTFGDVCESSEASYAVLQFFLNGGGTAWIVRVAPGFTPSSGGGSGAQAGNGDGSGSDAGSGSGSSGVQKAAIASTTVALGGGSGSEAGSGSGAAGGSFTISANSPGTWGNNLGVKAEKKQSGWTISVGQIVSWKKKLGSGSGSGSGSQSKVPVWATVETFYSLSTDPADPTYVVNVINQSSEYITAAKSSGGTSPTADFQKLEDGHDGSWGEGSSGAKALTDALVAQLTTSPALNQIAPEHFNIMCLPDAAVLSSSKQNAVYTAALQFCEDNQAFLIVDPPPPSVYFKTPGVSNFGATQVDSVDQVKSWSASYRNAENYSGAVYYPWLLIPDPQNNYNPRAVAPSGTLAGVYASTDLNRGVWKAPAGVDAVLKGITSLADTLTDADSGDLNPLGINALRTFPVYGPVIWGARTLAGADEIVTSFRYVDARRLTDFIEQSLLQSLVWAVFEPNGPPLWASITQEVNAFMADLYAKGAFQGATAASAYKVQCDEQTTTQVDIEKGVVNVVVAFAPIPPAEFVVLQVQVSAGQLTASS